MESFLSAPMGEMADTVRIVPSTDPIERSYREQADRLWRSLVLFCGEPEVASDAVSEAFAQAISRGPAIIDVDRWVWRSAFSIARGEMKGRHRQPKEMPDLPAAVPTDTIDLVKALSQLSPKQRASVILHHYAGYSTSETAALIGSTSGAVGMHLDRGRKRLRELLGDDDA
jgi:RNA polymerase sigma-70 factor (ECF subfamily)